MNSLLRNRLSKKNYFLFLEKEQQYSSLPRLIILQLKIFYKYYRVQVGNIQLQINYISQHISLDKLS